MGRKCASKYLLSLTFLKFGEPGLASHQNILVTGADGFIGSHLVEEFVRAGHNVRAFVFYNSFNSWGWLDEVSPEIKNNIEVISGDVRDPHRVKEAMRGIDTVVNLAALIAIPFSYESPDSYLDTNIRGTLNILQTAKELGTHVIHTSTSEVYGTARTVPINEEHPLHAQSPYAATKIGADQLAMSFYYAFGTKVSIIRPFNTYGPRQSARAVIPSVIIQLSRRQKKIKMGNLTPTRDFNYIRDTTRGFLAALNSERSIGQVINLGSAFEISIGETVQLISEIMNVSIEIEQAQERIRPDKSEVERLFADNSKARRLLDWNPEFGGLSGFRRGLTETIEWFSNPGNLSRYKSDIYNL